MSKRYVKRPCRPRPLCDAPTAACLDGYADAMHAQGYSVATCAEHLRAVSHLVEWAERLGVRLADLDEPTLARFVRHVSRSRYRGRMQRVSPVRFRVHRFLQYLRDAGIAATPTPLLPSLVAEYGAWMRHHRNLAESTIRYALPVVQALLRVVGEEPASFEAVGIRKFVLEYVERHAPASAGCITTVVRCFLRYLVAHARCSPDLIEAVPRVPTWRLARLPRYLTDAEVERIIAACDRTSCVARRDRAMVLLLARLGLRGHEVVGLRLQDLEWGQGRLRVVGKGGRVVRLPLPQDTGDAILEYLKTERPAVATYHVFLTARAPIRPLGASGLRDVVWRAIERAGVQAPSRGTHLLRHSLATRFLRDGATLDTIGAVLRHRDVDTTALYAKVDVGLLRQVAQPWPDTEVSPC